jgi:hypothetical protein
MQKPSRDGDTMFEEILQELPSELEPMAREFKAFTRMRKVESPQQLLRIALLYCGLDKSLRETAGEFSLLQQRITDEAVSQRLNACLPWIKALLIKMLDGNKLPVLEAARRWLVVDGSSIQGPGAKGTDYRLHLCLELSTLQFIEIKITDKHTSEGMRHYDFQQGDGVIGDRGYATAQELINTVEKGADVVVRMSAHNLPLSDECGVRWDLYEAIKEQPAATMLTFPVVVKSPKGKGQIEGYVHVYRLDEAAANKANRLRHKKNVRKGHTSKKSTLFFDGYVLVFTTIKPETLTVEAISAIYRVRWQIEIAIKRLKSLLDVGQLRSRAGGPLAELWLTGKMLYALLVDRRARKRLGDEWSALAIDERRATFWRVWKIIKDELIEIITGVAYWRKEGWKDCLSVLAERPRRRKLQSLPPQMVAKIQNKEAGHPTSERKAA